MMRVIHSSCSCIFITCLPSMLGYRFVSMHNSGDMPCSFDKTSYVKKSALAFFVQGICWNSTLLKYYRSSLTIFKYFFLPSLHNLHLSGQLQVENQLRWWRTWLQVLLQDSILLEVLHTQLYYWLLGTAIWPRTSGFLFLVIWVPHLLLWLS